MTQQIAHRTIVVTGASTGIGAAAAGQLAAAGARVLLVARREAELERVRQEIVQRGGQAWCYVADLSVVGQVEACADAMLAEHPQIHVLVNNAGRSIRRPVEEALDRFHDYQRTMQLNYFAAVRLTQKLLPGMLARGDGHIVNVSTFSVQMANPYFSAYVASKAALEGFSRCLAVEMVGRGVHVSLVNYPLVRTAMTAPTKVYDYLPQMKVDEAGRWIVEAIETRRARTSPRFGDAWGAVTLMLPKASTELTGRLFQFVSKRLRARAGRKVDPPR